MNKNKNGSPVSLPFHCIKSISSPEDTAQGRQVYAGQLPIQAILDLPTNENVRGYIVEAEGKRKKTPTNVHKAIRATLEDIPDMFSVLNGGLVIVAQSSEIDEKAKHLKLEKPSIINGSQTQGVIRDFLSKNALSSPIHIKFELVITSDPGLIAEISIARNFQNDVQSISIAGRRGQLEELEQSVREHYPTYRLQKSETQLPAEDTDYVDTAKILQVIAALVPQELWWKQGEMSKVYTYSQKATCLKDFCELYQNAHPEEEKTEKSDPKLREAYRFYLDIAPQAIALYDKWKEHQAFAGSGLRSIEREGRTIKEVPDGIIFPILAAHAEFVVKTKKGWRIARPDSLEDAELIEAAKRAYMEIAKSKPEIMGKTKACYTQIQQITSIYKKLLAKA